MPLDNHGRSSGVEKSISADYYVLVSRNSGATPWQWKSNGVRGHWEFGFMARALFPRPAPGSRAKLHSKPCFGKSQKTASGSGDSADATCLPHLRDTKYGRPGSLTPAPRRPPGPAFEGMTERAGFAITQ